MLRRLCFYVRKIQAHYPAFYRSEGIKSEQSSRRGPRTRQHCVIYTLKLAIGRERPRYSKDCLSGLIRRIDGHSSSKALAHEMLELFLSHPLTTTNLARPCIALCQAYRRVAQKCRDGKISTSNTEGSGMCERASRPLRPITVIGGSESEFNVTSSVTVATISCGHRSDPPPPNRPQLSTNERNTG